ncbi:MAG: hypothetical protein MJ116_10410 [Lachnospiraceae bacterium]|nr:hypothetical protein [Lachnospiraceae bacterium]
MADDAIKEILISNRWLFTENSFFVSIFRWLAWMITKGCISLAKAGLTIYNKAFGMVDFTQYQEVEDFITSFRPVVIAVICCSLFALGITLIIKRDRMPDILMRICLVALVLTSSTYIFSMLNDALLSGKDAIIGSSSATVVSEVVTANLYDILYIDEQTGLGNLTGDRADYPEYSSITDEEIELLDINAVLNYKTSEDITSEAKDILKHKVDFRKDGNHKLKEVYNGFGWNSSDDDDWFNGFYYRYKVDWVTLLMTLVSICLVYILMAYKVFRIIVELVLHRLLAVFTSANLAGNQKALKVLDSIKNSYIVALITCVMIKLYLLGSTYISSMTGVSGFVKGVFLLFLAFTVIDGPNLVQQLFGIDAGLRSTLGSMMALAHAGKGAADKVVSTAGDVIGGAMNIGGKIFHGIPTSGDGVIPGSPGGINGSASADAGAVNDGMPGQPGSDVFDDMSDTVNDALNGGFADVNPDSEGEPEAPVFDQPFSDSEEKESLDPADSDLERDNITADNDESMESPGENPMDHDALNPVEDQLSGDAPDMEDTDNNEGNMPFGNDQMPESFDEPHSPENGEGEGAEMKDADMKDPNIGTDEDIELMDQMISSGQIKGTPVKGMRTESDPGLFQKELQTSSPEIIDVSEWT